MVSFDGCHFRSLEGISWDQPGVFGAIGLWFSCELFVIDLGSEAQFLK